MTNTLKINDTLKEMGFDINSSFKGIELGEWRAFKFECSIIYKEKVIWKGDYKMGMAHCEAFHKQWEKFNKMTYNEKPALDKMNDKAIEENRVRIAEILKKDKSNYPSLSDVINSIAIVDGRCVYDYQSFNDWCLDYGYSSDSIKAKDTFDKCEEEGKAIISAIGRENYEKLLDIFQDY